jgi:kynurenine formamidase
MTASLAAVASSTTLPSQADAASRPGLPFLHWIDLSLPLESTPYEAGPLRVDYTDHRRGGDILGVLSRVSHYGSTARLLLAWVLNRLGIRALRARDFPDGQGMAWEHYRSLSTHHGTHLDAPWHFGPLCERQAAKTIDEIPLDWCFAPGLRIDVRQRPDPDWIRLRDIRSAVERDEIHIQPGRIVMLQTGMDTLWGTPEYLSRAPGVDPEGLAWIIDQGVRVIGIDAFGFDRPFGEMYREYRRTRDSLVLWPSHFVGRDKEYCHIEKLAHLDRLPGPEGFVVACFPVRVARGSAGWTRVAAGIPMPEGKHDAT